ncbi:MAG: APC family permease [Candidatus Acidiferrum sp.]
MDESLVSGPTTAVPTKRLLTLWDLIFFGIVLIQPIAPLPLYGVAQQLSDGHFTLLILIAMFAMMITAVSYGRMAALFPSAGSAYTYVGKGLNPHLGFLAGWAMFLDYLLMPLINTVWISSAMHDVYTPRIPFVVWAAIIAGIFTALNLLGIRSSARTNKVLLFFMLVVVGFFIVLAVRFLYVLQGWHGLLSIQPFYDPATFNSHRVWTAMSFAALTYIGFDGVTTLTEDVVNPKHNVLFATVLVCVFTGVFGGLEVYLGQRVWPNWHTFPSLVTAFMDICGRVGGPVLFNAMGVILILAAFGSGLAGGLGAAKLLFGMGRDNVLPRTFFGYVKPGTSTPTYNIILIGLLSFGGAEILNYVGSAYEHAGELLNFGAFLAFMGVNLATFWQFGVVTKPGYKRRVLVDIILPLFGFAFCALIWWNLNPLAKTAGGIWFAIGILYLAIKTHGFRAAPVIIDFSES